MEPGLDKPLKDLLQEAVRGKALNSQRLQQLTGIPESYIQALLDGQTEKLPAAPYVRGYLTKIGQLLELDANRLWQLYQEKGTPKTSGINDRLPTNRFTIKSLNKTVVLVSILIIGMAIYGIVGASRLLAKPNLVIYSPANEQTLSASSTILVSGKINARDIIKINGEGVVVDDNGNFAKEYSLQNGFNAFEFSVKRLLGKETKTVRQVIYQPAG